MNKSLALALVALILASVLLAAAGQVKFYRVEVIHQGGPYGAVLDGLRDGLQQLGYEEGKHFAMEIQDTKGDLKAVEAAARNVERDRVDVVYAVSTSVAMVIRRTTADIPIVFCVGGDPVALGLVDSFAKPGGRL